MSIQAYQKAATRAEAPRDLEFRAFGLVTAGLIDAAQRGRAELGVLVEALDQNKRLWAMLADDCISPDNKLAPPLKAQVISLSLWVARHSGEVLRTDAAIEDLIEVNRSIMEGLAGHG